MWRHFRRALCAALAVSAAFPLAGHAQQAPAGARPFADRNFADRELIAVLELESVGADRNLASALTDSLRESLLKTGRFTLVDRAQIDAILKEQAFQQSGCTTEECAVKVGKVLGVRQMVSGRIIKLDDTHWRVSANLIEVETAKTLRSESVIHSGDYVSLIERGTQSLAEKLAGLRVSEQAPSPPPPLPPRPRSAWPWIVTGLFTVGLAAGAYNEAQAVADSNAKQKVLAAQANAETNQTQYQALLSQIAEEKKKAQDASALSNELAAGAVLFAVWTIYLLARAPEDSSALRIVPAPLGTGGVQLLAVRTW